jgi:hypothetical protein
MRVKLERFESYIASVVGLGVHHKSRQKKLTEQKHSEIQGDRFDRYKTDIEGSAAELAVSKTLNLRWNIGVGRYHLPDVGETIHVRHTPYKTGHLIIRPGDPEEHPYILVTGQTPVFNIMGWVYGEEGMKDEYWRDDDSGEPAWWVPQGVLREMATLEAR